MKPAGMVGVGEALLPTVVMLEAWGLAAAVESLSGAATGATTGTDALGASAMLLVLAALTFVLTGVRSWKPVKYLKVIRPCKRVPPYTITALDKVFQVFSKRPSQN